MGSLYLPIDFDGSRTKLTSLVSEPRQPHSASNSFYYFLFQAGYNSNKSINTFSVKSDIQKENLLFFIQSSRFIGISYYQLCFIVFCRINHNDTQWYLRVFLVCDSLNVRVLLVCFPTTLVALRTGTAGLVCFIVFLFFSSSNVVSGLQWE